MSPSLSSHSLCHPCVLTFWMWFHPEPCVCVQTTEMWTVWFNRIVLFCFSFMVGESVSFPLGWKMPFSHAASKVILGMDTQTGDKGREGRSGLKPVVCRPLLENVSSMRSGTLLVLFILPVFSNRLDLLGRKRIFILCLKSVQGALYFKQDAERRKSSRASDVFLLRKETTQYI